MTPVLVFGGPIKLSAQDISAAIDRADAIAAAHSCGCHFFDAAGVEQVCDWAEGHR